MSLTAATCPATGKRRYATKARAFKMAKWTARTNRQGRKTETDRVPVHAYRCDLCDGFHVGHKAWARDRLDRSPK